MHWSQTLDRFKQPVAVFLFALAAFLFWGELAGSLLQRDAGVLTGQSFAPPYINPPLEIPVETPTGYGITMRTNFAPRFSGPLPGVAMGIAGLVLCGITIIYHIALALETLYRCSRAKLAAQRSWGIIWQSIVRQQFKRYLYLSMLHVGAAIWYANLTERAFQSGKYESNYYEGYRVDVILATPGEILLAALMLTLLTLINLAFTAACGVLVSSWIHHAKRAFIISIVLRLMLPVLLVWLWWVAFYRLPVAEILPDGYRDSRSVAIHEWISMSVLDNGAAQAGSVAAARANLYTWDHSIIRTDLASEQLVALVAVSIFYILLTLLLLRLARRYPGCPSQATTHPQPDNASARPGTAA